MINTDIFYIQTWDKKKRVDFAQAVTSMRVNYSISGSSQLTVELADFRMQMWNNNYFQIGTPVIFRGERFRMSSVEIRAGEGEYATVKLEIRTQAVQEMREDKKPQDSYKSTTGFEFAAKVAKHYNLIPVIQEVDGVKFSTIKVKVKNNRESVWDVLQRSAQDIQFVCFVSDGRLVYASPQWLLGRWGIDKTDKVEVKTYGGKKEKRELFYVPLVYPADVSHRFFLLEMPNMRRSEDAPRESEGSVQLWAGDKFEEGIGSAYNIRAGMTAYVYGIHGFDQPYIITSVDYQYGVSEPVELALATVEKMAPEDANKMKKKIQETTVISGGTTGAVTN